MSRCQPVVGGLAWGLVTPAASFLLPQMPWGDAQRRGQSPLWMRSAFGALQHAKQITRIVRICQHV